MAEAEEGLWVLGDNSFGQLGLGHTNSALQPTPTQVEHRSEGPLRCLAAYEDGVVLIDSQGGVFSSGGNIEGQLGRSISNVSVFQQISNIPPMLTASCGSYHTLSLDENGNVWSWGWNGHGQLGEDPNYEENRPHLVPTLNGISSVVAGRNHSLAFPQEGGLLVFGHNRYGELGFPHETILSIPTLCSVQPALPSSATRSKNKSARFL